MRRAAIERLRTLRVWRCHLGTHHDSLFCDCELQPGRFRKSQRVGGCGQPRCWLCHFDKLADVPSARELRARATYVEGMDEVILH